MDKGILTFHSIISGNSTDPNAKYIKYRERRLAYDKNLRIKRKEMMFIILQSDVCVRCGFSDKRALQFDHKNGDGKIKRTQHKGRTSEIRYYINHPDEARETLQVLCANCNWIKRAENNEVRGKVL